MATYITVDPVTNRKGYSTKPQPNYYDYEAENFIDPYRDLPRDEYQKLRKKEESDKKARIRLINDPGYLASFYIPLTIELGSKGYHDQVKTIIGLKKICKGLSVIINIGQPEYF